MNADDRDGWPSDEGGRQGASDGRSPARDSRLGLDGVRAVPGSAAGHRCLFAYLTRDSGSFLTAYNWRTIAVQTVIVGTAALGMTMIMIAGGIDLSVGSVVALVTVVTALLVRDVGLADAVGDGGRGSCSGGVCGLFNGGLITAAGGRPVHHHAGKSEDLPRPGEVALDEHGGVRPRRGEAVVVRPGPGDRAGAALAAGGARGLDPAGAERAGGPGAQIQPARPLHLCDRLERGDRAAVRDQRAGGQAGRLHAGGPGDGPGGGDAVRLPRRARATRSRPTGSSSRSSPPS